MWTCELPTTLLRKMIVVMAGLVPGIDVFADRNHKDMDGRDKPSHDGPG
jgi:hypothetical protein